MLILPSRKLKFKESEVIYSKRCGFLHSLNNHLLNVHCVPGTGIITAPDTVVRGHSGFTPGVHPSKARDLSLHHVLSHRTQWWK